LTTEGSRYDAARIDTGAHLLAAALLMLAGADHDRIARWVEVGVNGRRHRGIASEGAPALRA
jgi:hypothetical protein